MVKILSSLFLCCLTFSSWAQVYYTVTSEVNKTEFLPNESPEVTYTLILPRILEVKERFTSADFRSSSKNQILNAIVYAKLASESKTFAGGSKSSYYQLTYTVRLIPKKAGRFALPKVKFELADTTISYAPHTYITVGIHHLDERDSLLLKYGRPDFLDIIILEETDGSKVFAEHIPAHIRLGKDTIKIQFVLKTRNEFLYSGFQAKDFTLKKNMALARGIFRSRKKSDEQLTDVLTVTLANPRDHKAFRQEARESNVYYLIPSKDGLTMIDLGNINIGGKDYPLGRAGLLVN